MSRERLPNRRLHYARVFDYHGRAYHCGASYLANGSLGEIFLTTSKAGSEAQQHAETAAVLASLLLQHNVPVDEIIHSITGSPVAIALELLAVEP